MLNPISDASLLSQMAKNNGDTPVVPIMQGLGTESRS